VWPRCPRWRWRRAAITTTVDLFGRTTTYVDAHSTWTGYGYDDLGKLVRMYGDHGEQGFTYDNTNRLVEQRFDGAVVARPYYDQFGRLDHVDYPSAGTLALTSVGHDALGRTTGYTWPRGRRAVVHRPSTPRPTNSATRWSAASTGSNATAAWPPATTARMDVCCPRRWSDPRCEATVHVAAINEWL
jgi:YD repeat-containing protein